MRLTVASDRRAQFANRRACVFAIVGTALFYGGSIGLLCLLLQLRGNGAWESTMLHFPTEYAVFALDALLPPLACAFVLVRSYHFPYMLVASSRDVSSRRRTGYRKDDDLLPGPPPSLRERGLELASSYVRCLLLGDTPTYSDMAMIYLCKVYLLATSILALLLLTCVQARYYSFTLPQLMLVRFDAEAGWQSRFHLLTLQLMGAILVGVHALMLRLWPSSELSTAHYDKLYSLALIKHEQKRGSTAKCDPPSPSLSAPPLAIPVWAPPPLPCLRGPRCVGRPRPRGRFLPQRHVAASSPAPRTGGARASRLRKLPPSESFSAVGPQGGRPAAVHRSDDVIGMLEEETEALIRRGYSADPDPADED